MRKFVILAGLLAGAALFTTGASTPANATWVGCQCVKLGAPSACMKGVLECSAWGGVCLAPCDYTPAMKKHHHHRHHKKAMKKEDKK